MARKRNNPKSDRTILLIDDTEEYLAAARRLLVREGHTVLTAASAREGLALAGEHRVDLVLVDYFMPVMTGEDFVVELRKSQPFTQVILQTGYASEQPPRELLKRLDIQGYHDKSEGPDKLLLWVDVGLRAAYSTQLLHKSREALEYILEATPELQKPQPLQQLLQGILLQLSGLFGVVDSFLAVRTDASVQRNACLFVCEGDELAIRAGTGRFAVGACSGLPVDDEQVQRLTSELHGRGPTVLDSATAIPLSVGTSSIGAIYVDRIVSDPREQHLLQVFANQAATAIQNTWLFDMAANDPLTGCLARRFFDAAVQRELRTAHRYGRSVGILLVDVDDMKGINDTWGHLQGDHALTAVAECIKETIRSTDLVGRIGGDEFAVLLPDTPPRGLDVVRSRVQAGLRTLAIRGPEGELPVGASVGGHALDLGPATSNVPSRPPRALEDDRQRLFTSADEDLYRRKRAHRRRASARPRSVPADASG